MGARQLTPVEQMSSPRGAGRGREKRGTAPPHRAQLRSVLPRLLLAFCACVHSAGEPLNRAPPASTSWSGAWAHCHDNLQDGDETGVDCGGANCAPCSQPTWDDGVQNGDETGVDCGGSGCPACPATCDDGVQNGDETGVDCGGSSCSPCFSGSCDAPTGTAAVNIKRKRATLTWNAMPGAVSYTAQFRVAGATNWTIHDSS